MSEPKAAAYLVTSGEYSDYRVDRVYLDEASAEQYAERLRAMGGDHVRVEVYPIGEPVPLSDKQVWYVAWDEDDEDWDCPQPSKSYRLWLGWEGDPGPARCIRSEESASWRRPGEKRCTFAIAGTNPDAVIKAARDRIRAIKAERAGVA